MILTITLVFCAAFAGMVIHATAAAFADRINRIDRIEKKHPVNLVNPVSLLSLNPRLLQPL